MLILSGGATSGVAVNQEATGHAIGLTHGDPAFSIGSTARLEAYSVLIEDA
jgi:hypothetical protein